MSKINRITVLVKTNKPIWLPQPQEQRLYHTIELQHGIYVGILKLGDTWSMAHSQI